MAWRLAKSLGRLRKQINAKFPNRSKVSDGTIGDAKHAKRKSDHNPNEKGVVCAFDVTHDPKNGVNCGELAKKLAKDKRVKYLIWNRQITEKGNPSKWKPYTGANPHDKHLHISVNADYDDPQDWEI
jgi:hypothetical protein